MITSLDEKTALLLIDLQNGIVQLPMATSASDVISRATELAKAFQKAGLPIFLLNVDPRKSPFNPLRKDAKGTNPEMDENWFKIVPELDHFTEVIRITKTSWNAFTNPDTNTTLKSNGITGIVLAGISTSVGVEGTARAAAENGYNITFATDAMTDMVAEAHDRSIRYIFPRLGELGTVAEIIQVLQRE